MVYTNQEAYDMLQILFEARSFSAAERLWRIRFPDRFPHSRKVFSRLSNRVRNDGIVQPHHNKGRKIRRRIRDERSADVLASSIISPHDSLRRREIDSGVSYSTIHNILKENKFHPYRIQLHQDLNNYDIAQRLAFCNWCHDQPAGFHQRILWTDECTFKSDATVNTWNFRYWAPQNPHWLRTIDRQHIWKVNVWCGIFDDKIIGPIIFDGNLNSQRYVQLLETDLPNLLEDIPLNLRLNMWFQQDGCPSHTARTPRAVLNRLFTNRWIGKYGTVAWPARSPDLSVLDYYLWGRVKELVYRDRPTTRENMIERIRQSIQSLEASEIRRAVNHFPIRVQTCFLQNGAHFEHY